MLNPGDEKLSDDVRIVKESNMWRVVLRIPFERIGMSKENTHPLRIDVRVHKNQEGISSWRPNTPLPYRNELGTDNSADLGWLLFSK